MVQVFTPNDETTATYFSDKIGPYAGVATSQSSGFTTSSGPNSSTSSTSGSSSNPAAVPFMSVQDMYGMPEWQSILFVRGSDDPVLAFKQHYWLQPAFAGLATPNPYRDSEGFKRAWHGQPPVLSAPPPLDPFEEALESGRAFSYLLDMEIRHEDRSRFDRCRLRHDREHQHGQFGNGGRRPDVRDLDCRPRERQRRRGP